MKKNDKRPTYEPPKAIDLSGSSVSGGKKKKDPKPNCQKGNTAFLYCKKGKQFGGS